MKKIIVTVLIVASLVSLLSVQAGRTIKWNTKLGGKEVYSTNLIVNKIDRKKNIVWCKNWSGVQYKFYGVEDLEKGDVISCIMYTKGTPKIKDDVVLSAKYERVDLLR